MKKYSNHKQHKVVQRSGPICRGDLWLVGDRSSGFRSATRARVNQLGCQADKGKSLFESIRSPVLPSPREDRRGSGRILVRFKVFESCVKVELIICMSASYTVPWSRIIIQKIILEERIQF